jgi:hypothetical protein
MQYICTVDTALAPRQSGRMVLANSIVTLPDFPSTRKLFHGLQAPSESLRPAVIVDGISFVGLLSH